MNYRRIASLASLIAIKGEAALIAKKAGSEKSLKSLCEDIQELTEVLHQEIIY